MAEGEPWLVEQGDAMDDLTRVDQAIHFIILELEAEAARKRRKAAAKA